MAFVRLDMRRLALILLVLIGCGLAWQVITRSLVVYLADAAPDLARLIDPELPAVVVSDAERKLQARLAEIATDRERKRQAVAALGLGEASQRFAFGSAAKPQPGSGAAQIPAIVERERVLEPAEAAQMRDVLERALMREPFDARAVRILGQLADDAGDRARTAAAMRVAARLSLRESTAVYWLLMQAAEARDYPAAIAHADALLRSRPGLSTLVVPVLVAIAESPGGSAPIIAALGSDPPWRGQLLASMPGLARDERTPLQVLTALKQSPKPPTVHDYRAYIDHLLGRQSYELAYYTWLQSLTPEQLASTGFLFNGGFLLQPSGLPFDWVLRDGPGVTVEIAQLPSEPGQNALVIEFGVGRVEFPGVTQHIMLGAGSYRLKGRHRGEIIGVRGLRWRVVCAGGGRAPLGEGEMLLGAVPNWREFDLRFTVPGEGCRAQVVRLDLDARSASEQLVTGRMSFDDLVIARVPPAPRR